MGATITVGGYLCEYDTYSELPLVPWHDRKGEMWNVTKDKFCVENNNNVTWEQLIALLTLIVAIVALCLGK